MNKGLKLVIAILLPLAVGGISGFFTAAGVEGWYLNVKKPSFNPPNWLFAPVWTVLYLLMGISLYLVWREPAEKPYRTTALCLFGIQLFLNFCWSFLFFKMQQPAWAFADILLLWIFILLTIIWFYRVKPIAGYLQIPYLCWVSFASVLNFCIWQLNS